MTVVLVEQDTNRAIRTAEFTTVMLKGKTVLSGRSKELGDDEIKAAYFGL
jgi:ABC-type branched-subunit amino acid transport system ATPase component